MFYPPFCPNPRCDFHNSAASERWWKPAGFYLTTAFGRVPRYLCRKCGRGFSTQTFSLDYFAKFRLRYEEIEALLASSMSVRAMARHFNSTPRSILNRIDRLARQAIACHANLRPGTARREDVSIDGFVSFDRSQYFPNNLTIAITAGSRFVLSFTHATLRRSGSMRLEQRLRRDELYAGLRFEPRAIERSFTELLDFLGRDRPPRLHAPLVLITDEKTEYLRAFQKHSLYRDQDEEHRIAHLRVSSKAPRTYINPLFASNYLDRELRKDQAAHRRETTCFCRNVANGLSRLACYCCWHNYRKKFLIKSSASDTRTHGEVAGLTGDLIALRRKEMFSLRSFLSRLELDSLERRVWLKAYSTPLKTGKEYLPAYAVA